MLKALADCDVALSELGAVVDRPHPDWPVIGRDARVGSSTSSFAAVEIVHRAPVFIEVETTRYSKEVPFYTSGNEVEASRQPLVGAT